MLSLKALITQKEKGGSLSVIATVRILILALLLLLLRTAFHPLGRAGTATRAGATGAGLSFHERLSFWLFFLGRRRFLFLLHRRGSFLLRLGRGSYITLGLLAKLKLLIRQQSNESFGVVRPLASFFRTPSHQGVVIG